MYGGYDDREEYEDELYREEGDSSSSEADTEVEFRLYSQLHYSSHLGEEEGQAEKQEDERTRPKVAEQQPNSVILISSDPEVITISDSTEDEDGVCAAKGQVSRPRPADRRGRPATPATPQSAPQSSGSDSDSDSDGVEAWMVLGQDRQESDNTIQLNVMGGVSISSAEDEDDDDGHKWKISSKDVEAQICNQGPGRRRTPSRYYTGKSVTCRSCNKMGHLSKNCPTPRKLPSCTLCGSQTHLQKTCPNRYCTNCSLPGHCYDDCLERAYWHKHCHRCGMTGHFYDACPDIWRQYHLTTLEGPILKPDKEEAPRTPAYCYNCSRQGHFGFECNQRRMFNGTYPSAPYVSYYDTPRDIRQRESRAQRRAQELREAGLLQSTEPEQRVQPQVWNGEEEPPRKKAKMKNKDWEKKGKSGAPSAKAKKAKRQQHQQQQHQPPQHQTQQQQKKRTVGKRRERRQLKNQQKEAQAQTHAQAQHRHPGKRKDGLAEEEDFPRGPKRRPTGAPTAPRKGSQNPNLFGSGKVGKRCRARGRDRKPGNSKVHNMYPFDENLFLIKQRRKK